jgi:nucleotide-binding universal stress UspA family protein
MRALVWISEGTWEACVKQARTLLPTESEVTLLHVSPTDVEALAAGGREGLLGRRRTRPTPALQAIAADEAQELLTAAQARLGLRSDTVARRGRVEHEVVAACRGADLLVLARDGSDQPGPKSLGPRTRFVVDHAPCPVLLVWSRPPRRLDIPPPPPHHPRKPPRSD